MKTVEERKAPITTKRYDYSIQLIARDLRRTRTGF
jgi:hypothetical protein